MSDYIFIGRKKQINELAISLESLFDRSFSLLKFLQPKRGLTLERPRIFLFHGEGGFGKSELLYQCCEEARRRKVKVIHLDWDEYYNAKNTLPNTSRKMITALFTVLTDPTHGIAHHFNEYIEIEKKVKSIAEKVERVWQQADSSKAAEWITKTGSAVANAHGIPVPKVAQDAISAGLGKTAEEFRRMVINTLRENRKMQREELDLYENDERALTYALVAGIAAASQRKPLLLAIDTYERVDEADIDAWMRKVFLKALHEKAPRACVLLAGRNNHYLEYRDHLPEQLLYKQDMDDILFTKEEIAEFAQAYRVSLSERDIRALRKGTEGIPLVVRDVLSLLRDGKDKASVLQDLEARRGEVEAIIEGIVKRFLKYTEELSDGETDRHRCYQLAILYNFEADILQKTWGLDAKAFKKAMDDLARRHSFIHPRTHRMHARVRAFLRDDLLNRLRNENADTALLRELITPLQDACQERLKKLEVQLATLDACCTDERYCKALTDALLCQCWQAKPQVLQILPGYLTELLVFNPNAATQVATELLPLTELFPAVHRATLRTLLDGVLAHEGLYFENSETPPTETQLRLLRQLEQNPLLQTTQRALLAHLQGQYLVRQGQYPQAMETLKTAEVVLQNYPITAEERSNVFFRIGYLTKVKKPDFQLSLEAYNQAIVLQPDDAAAYNNRGNVYQNIGNTDAALSDYNKAIELQPDDADAYNNRGNVYKNIGNPDAALSDYTKAIELKPDYAAAYYNRGILYDDIGNPDAALSDYSKAIALKPDYAAAYYNRGILYKNIGNPDAALKDYAKAIALKPDDADAYNNRGNLHCDLGNPDAALSDYAKAIELKPDDATAYYNRGILYENLSSTDAALGDFNRAIELKADYADAYIWRGNLHQNIGNTEAALGDYNQAIALKPDDADAYYNRGNLQDDLGNPDAALSDYNQAIELKPDYADAYNNRGSLYQNIGNTDAALSDYAKAIELKPDDADAYNNRGNVYQNIGNTDAALSDYAKAIELQPDYADAYNNRGILYDDLGKPNEALRDYNQAIELEPDYADAYTNRGSLYDNLGEYEKALLDYVEAIRLEPEDADNYNNRSNTYRRMGNYEAARQDVRKSLELDPEYSYAWGTLAEIYAQQGEHELFYENIEIALQKGYPEEVILEMIAKDDPAYAPYKDETRFQALLAQYRSGGSIASDESV